MLETLTLFLQLCSSSGLAGLDGSSSSNFFEELWYYFHNHCGNLHPAGYKSPPPTFAHIYHLLSFDDSHSHRSEADLITVQMGIFMKIHHIWDFPTQPVTICMLPFDKRPICLFLSSLNRVALLLLGSSSSSYISIVKILSNV